MPDQGLTFYDIAKAFVLPPGSLILLLIVGVSLLALGWRRFGFVVTLLSVLVFYALSTPAVAGRLSAAAQYIPSLDLSALKEAEPAPEAIVVLAAGLMPFAPEYGGSTVDEVTLQRLAYAAFIWRQRQLPVLVSGGRSREANGALANLMKDTLEKSFGVPVTWTEDKSADTFENAQFSAEILKAADVSRIILVTHAAHMPRSVALFRAAGLTVMPAPTAFSAPSRSYIGRFLPRQSAMQTSYTAIYELMGTRWYVLRGKLKPGSTAPNASAAILP